MPALFTSVYATAKACRLSSLVVNDTTVAAANASLPADGTWSYAKLAAAFNNTILVDTQRGSPVCAGNVCRTLQLALSLASQYAAQAANLTAARIVLLNDVTLTASATLPGSGANPTNLTFLLLVGSPNIDGSPRKLFVDSATIAGGASTYAISLSPAPASLLVVGLQALPANAATAAALITSSVPGGVLFASAASGAVPRLAVHDVFVDTGLELAGAAVSLACSNTNVAGGCAGSIGAAYNVRLLGGATAPSGAVAFAYLQTVVAANVSLAATCPLVGSACSTTCRFASRALGVSFATNASVSSVAVSSTCGLGVRGLALYALRPGSLAVQGVSISGATNYSGGVYVDVHAVTLARYVHEETAVTLSSISVAASQPVFGAAAIVVAGSAESPLAGSPGQRGPLVSLQKISLVNVACTASSAGARFSTANASATVTLANSYGCGALVASFFSQAAAWPRVLAGSFSASGVGGVDFGGALAVIGAPLVAVTDFSAVGARAALGGGALFVGGVPMWTSPAQWCAGSGAAPGFAPLLTLARVSVSDAQARAGGAVSLAGFGCAVSASTIAISGGIATAGSGGALLADSLAGGFAAHFRASLCRTVRLRLTVAGLPSRPRPAAQFRCYPQRL